MSLVELEQHQIAERLRRMGDAEDRPLLIVKSVLLMVISDEMRHGVPDRVIPAASRARQLALTGLDAAGIAERVRVLHEQESEAVAG